MDNFIIPNVYSTPMTAGAYSDKKVIQTGECKLLGFVAQNASSAGSRWIQVHDLAALPSNGVVPMLSILISASAQGGFDVGPLKALAMKNGLSICVSSTGPTLTQVTGSASEGAFLTVFWI